MSQFEEFKEKFEKTFEGRDLDSKISEFIYKFFDKNENPLNGEIKENNDEEQYDSYGSEDSKLNRVFYFPEFDIFVQFLGTRQSYQGEEWDEMKEVKPVTKTIETYE
jgi:hypothetical protein